MIKEQKNAREDKLSRREVVVWALRLILHTGAVLAVAVISLVPFVNTYTLGVLREEATLGSLPVEAFQVGLHLGIAACGWVMLVLVWQYLQEARRSGRKPKRLVKARGTVIVETLIVLPVLLLLLLGISQLAFHNIANMLSNAAAYHAARAVSVWHGEPSCTGSCSPESMAALQAAMILAPVVPGQQIGYEGDQLPDHVLKAMGIMVGTQRPLLSSDMGFYGTLDAQQHLNNQNQSFSFAAAFDTASFPARSAIKLAGAYTATSVSYTISNRRLNVEMEYKHRVSMPLMPGIFGEPDTVGGRSGHYTTFNRTVQQPAQVVANRTVPSDTIAPPRRFF